MTRKPQSIKTFQPGEEVQGYYLVREKNLKRTRNGAPYLDLMLQDRTGIISARIWDGAKDVSSEIEEGEPVVVKGQVDVYRNRLQLNVQRISRVREEHEEYGFSVDSLVRSSERSSEEMWKDLESRIKSIKNKDIKKLLKLIFEKHKEAFSTFPAAKFIHHNFRGGLLEHTLSLAADAVYYAGKFPDVDKDLLLAGALLHDIGKIRELTGEMATEYTDEGNFVGHIVLGRDILREAAAELDSFPADTLLEIEHLNLSHQGRYEFASPRRPVTRKALILHFIDELDAKLNIFNKAIDEDHSDGKWTGTDNYFGMPLSKGDVDKKS